MALGVQVRGVVTGNDFMRMRFLQEGTQRFWGASQKWRKRGRF